MLLNHLTNKRSLLILLVFILVFSAAVYAAKHTLPEQAAKGKNVAQAQKEKFCETDEIKESLKKILYQRLTDPDSVPLTLDEIKDLLSFYLNIEEGAATAKCSTSVLGFLSKRPILDIINKGINLPDKIPVCSDGTKYGECSATEPLHCTARGAVDRCQKCGCPAGGVCSKSTGKCESSGQNIACYSDLDCGAGKFTRDYYCSNNYNYVTKDYINYTCENAGTVDSRCISSIYSITLEYCDPNSNKICVDGAGSCQATAITCPDGTQNNQCSATKPLYCKDGTLIDNCNTCGCLAGKVCSSAGACVENQTQPSFEIVPVTASGSQGHPAIHNNKIVWVDGNGHIFMYDLSTGKKTKITREPVNGVTFPDIYNDKIVYTGTESDQYGYSHDRVYMHDLSTGKVTQIITKFPYLDWSPKIHNNKIVWEGSGGTWESAEILLYDISTGETSRLTYDSWGPNWESISQGIAQANPDIYGDKVVWQDGRHAGRDLGPTANWDIYMYDLSTGQETQITNSTYAETYPAIYGDKIVYRNSIYDISTGQVTLTTTQGIASHPAIYGDKVVWQDERIYGNYDIYMYDISTGKETQITTDPGNQMYPDIYGNTIVWWDYDYGDGEARVYMTTIS